MTKIKAMLIAAATLVVGGVALDQALNQAAVQEGVTRPEWCAATEAASLKDARHFYVAFQPKDGEGDDNPIPEAYPDGSEGNVLGTCGNGLCSITPAAIPECGYSYTYKCGPLVNTWRVCDIHAIPYFARGWRLAAGGLSYVRWYGTCAEVIAACRANFTGAECLELLNADRGRWLLSDGRTCNLGRVQGDETTACPYALVEACITDLSYDGAGGWLIEATQTFTEEEMGEL